MALSDHDDHDRKATDAGAVVRGAMVALVAVIPAALVQSVASGGARSVAFLVTLAGFGAGGYVAGSRQPRRGLSHGGLAGLAAGTVVLIVGIVRRAVIGEATAWSGLPLLVLLAYSSGAIGGYVAFRRAGASIDEEQPT